jgi:hypothetical protein
VTSPNASSVDLEPFLPKMAGSWEDDIDVETSIVREQHDATEKLLNPEESATPAVEVTSTDSEQPANVENKPKGTAIPSLQNPMEKVEVSAVATLQHGEEEPKKKDLIDDE